MTARTEPGSLLSAESLDVFATVNPAFCGLIVYSFVAGYAEASAIGPELSLAFLPVPIAASQAVAATFAGTNAKTSLLDWLARNPEIALELPDQIRAAIPISRRALIFSLQRRVLEFTGSGLLMPQAKQLKRKPQDAAGEPIERRSFTVAKRFGHWCGSLGSAAMVFTCLGVRP